MIQKREIDATGMSIKREERFGYSSWRDLLSSYRLSAGSSIQEWRYRYNAMGERESKRLYRKLRISEGGGDHHHDMTIAPDTAVVRVEVTRVSGDPPFFHGLVNIGGDARGATFSENTITFSDTALADLGENIIIYGEATLTTSNSDTTMVNFIGEVRLDSAGVSTDTIIFHGLVGLGGDTTGITFSGDTAIVPDTVEFIEPFSDSLIITIVGNTAWITFPDTVIIAVDSTKPRPNNPASTAVFGGARLTMRNYRVSPYPWTYYLLGGSKEQLSVWQGTQTSEVGFCGSTGGSQIYFYPTEYLTYGGRSANITTHPNGTQEYRIADHLGSNRVTLDNTGSVVTTTDYEPYGKAIAGVPPRKGFIDKEKDQESNLGDFGVRKYDDEIGRFTSIDPLTEKMPAWSPYVYSFNSPLVLIDPNGRFPGDYYDVDGNHLGSDEIDDDKVYIVEGASEFNIKNFQEGGKYFENHAAFNENGDGFSVNYEGQVSDVFKTWDPITNERITGLHPVIRMKATNLINQVESELGTQLRISQGRRTIEEQNALYAQGRTTPGKIVTKARGGSSYHNFGLAFDIVGIEGKSINYNLDYSTISTIGKEMGLQWGGDFKSIIDKPHFQMTFGRSTKYLLQLYNSGITFGNGYVKVR